MALLKKLSVLLLAVTPALAVLGKIGTTTNHKGNPLGVGKDLCENIGYTGPVGNVYKRPLLEDCKKLLSNAENMGDNDVFRVEEICENNKKDWELRFSFQTCGLFLRPVSLRLSPQISLNYCLCQTSSPNNTETTHGFYRLDFTSTSLVNVSILPKTLKLIAFN